MTLIRTGEPLFSSPQSLVLPVVTLLAGSSAGSIRMVRACMIDVLSSDYIEMVRLKGVSERRLILRHALPNALGTTIQVLALTAAVLAGGVVVVETLFQFPGMGNELVGSVSARDVPTVEAIVMVITAFYVVVNLREPGRHLAEPATSEGWLMSAQVTELADFGISADVGVKLSRGVFFRRFWSAKMGRGWAGHIDLCPALSRSWAGALRAV